MSTKRALAGLMLIALAGGCNRDQPSPARIPTPGINVVLIVVDTLRADHLESYGYHRQTMPIVSRLAREGALFERAFCQATWTGASMSSLFTSQYPSTHGYTVNTLTGGRSNYLHDEFTTLPEMLKDNGYKTIGHVTNVFLSGYLGFGQGFDSYVEHVHLADADSVTDAAIADLKFWARKKNKPLFLYVHYMEPHSPYAPPDDYLTRFDSLTEELVPNTARVPAYISVGSRDLNDFRDHYDGEIRFANDEISRLIDTIDSLELKEKTLVIFTSDHGEEIYDHGRFGHGKSFFDEVLRVPLVLRFPKKIPANTRIRQIAELVDVTPTVLDLIEIETPVGLQGTSLLTLLTEGHAHTGESRNKIAFAELHIKGPRRIMGRTAEWKAICARQEGEDPKLLAYYDLREDPLENNNLAETLAKDRVDGLIEQLTEWQIQREAEGQFIDRTQGRPLSSDSTKRLKELGYLDDESETEGKDTEAPQTQD